VAAITFANGGDNIGIYTPLFASMNLQGFVVTVITFLLLVIVWCLIAIWLTRQKHVAQVLSQYGHIIVPIVLIGLGIYIIVENGTLHLIGL
jgi:cadmium resistance protein CadD (predicted permease)